MTFTSEITEELSKLLDVSIDLSKKANNFYLVGNAPFANDLWDLSEEINESIKSISKTVEKKLDSDLKEIYLLRIYEGLKMIGLCLFVGFGCILVLYVIAKTF